MMTTMMMKKKKKKKEKRALEVWGKDVTVVIQRAKPLPSPVQRYKASNSRRRWCCSPRSSGIRPRTCARALRITLLKLRY